jgi:peptidoglycan/LPS O-acetylase OafA/YrhL
MKIQTSDHIPELDGVRGCAITMVLLFHFAPDLPKNRILMHTLGFGWTGVNLFFVLSGFLITRILLRTRDRHDYFRSFYFRRALRIFPVYYWTLAVAVLLFGAVPALNGILPLAHDRFFYWFYLSNWTPLLLELNQRSFGHFWSLAVEEQFYWIWPIVVLFVKPQRLVWVAVGIFASAVLLRIAFVDTHYWFIRWNTFCQTDALMMGALCALAWEAPTVAKSLACYASYIGAAIPCIILAVVVGDHWLGDKFTATIGVMALALAFGALLWYATVGPLWLSILFRSPILTGMGKYSYGIYVYHQPIYLMLIQLHLVQRGWATFAASLMASILLGALSYELVERRILKLKSRKWLTVGASQSFSRASERLTGE